MLLSAPCCLEKVDVRGDLGLARLMFRIADTLEPKVGGWVGRTGWDGYFLRHVEVFSATWN